MAIIFPWLFYDFSMTLAKNSMTFYMNYGMKEEYWGKEGGCDRPFHVWFGVSLNRMWWQRLNRFLFLCCTYHYPCVDVWDLKEEPNNTVLQEDTLKFPWLLWFFQNLESNSITFPGVPRLDTSWIRTVMICNLNKDFIYSFLTFFSQLREHRVLLLRN